jgi:SAM-dependent methyltransferase
MAAKMVGSTGTVTAIDFDPEIIRLAEIDKAQEGLDHLSFHVKSSYDIDYSNVFDFSYARFLLSHLKDPLAALHRMKEAVKPGGKIVVEDVHFSGHFCYPHHESFARYLELYTAVVSQRGGNAELGPQLPGLFQQADIREVGFDVIQPCFDHGEGKWMGYITLARIRDAVIDANLADTRELDRLLRQLEEFTSRPDTILSLPRIFRVWGVKG